MEYVFAPIFWILIIASAVAAWFGITHYAGIMPGSVLFALLILSRWTWWIGPMAFIGAWQSWHWPWYAALPVAAPGMVLVLATGSVVASAKLLEAIKVRGR